MDLMYSYLKWIVYLHKRRVGGWRLVGDGGVDPRYFSVLWTRKEKIEQGFFNFEAFFVSFLFYVDFTLGKQRKN